MIYYMVLERPHPDAKLPAGSFEHYYHRIKIELHANWLWFQLDANGSPIPNVSGHAATEDAAKADAIAALGGIGWLDLA